MFLCCKRGHKIGVAVYLVKFIYPGTYSRQPKNNNRSRLKTYPLIKALSFTDIWLSDEKDSM